MKDRPLEEEIHARLRQLTTEVRALRQDLEGTLRNKPTSRAIRSLTVRRDSVADAKRQARRKK